MNEVLSILGTRLRETVQPERAVSVRLDPELRPRRPLPEHVRLFHAINSLNEHHKPFILQIVASLRGEGTSITAAALSGIAARDAVMPVLLVDCNPQPEADLMAEGRVPTLVEAFRSNGKMEAAIQQPVSNPKMQLARLTAETDGVLGASPAELQLLFDTLRTHFSMVVLDCPAALLNPVSLALARYCDGSALVVRAAKTKHASIVETKQLIERLGGQIIGIVFNRQSSQLPGWLKRVLGQ